MKNIKVLFVLTAIYSLWSCENSQIDIPVDTPELPVSNFTISGTVILKDAETLNAAQIQLNFDGKKYKTITSGENGDFSFTGLKTGLYSIDVSKTGFSTSTLDFALTQDKENIKITLGHL